MSPGLNPQNVLSFRASLFRRISIIINLSMLLFDFVLSRGANPKFDDCQPQNCGIGPNISYPFWIPKVQQPYCGIPGFDIECNNSRPIYRTFGSSYAIKEISYYENSFRVVNEAVLNAGCPLPGLNYSFERLPVTFGPDHAELCIFHNCDGSFSVNFTTSWAECGPGDGSKSFAAIASMCDYLNWNRASCQYLVAVPVQVQNWKVNQSVEYLKLLEDGFTLNWTGYNCTRCRRSGGRCGSQNSASVCYCPDRTDLIHCGNAAQHRMLVMKVAIAAAGVGIAIVILIVYSIRKKSMIRKHIALMMGKKEHSATTQQIEGLISSRRYTYKDIKRMTNSFQEKLGQGGYGYVYKGKLRDGQLVAVKLLKKLKGYGEEFINEVASISRTSHVNVVSLLGFCFEGSKRALVYEFMPNGSLEKFIFKSNTSEANQQLSWETLYSISMGIALGLEYLHQGCNARILHFDIKPHNILIDCNYCPKISDFGLAKICPREESIVSMLGARGTAGYIAPELIIRNIGGVSHKSDVYSYGMMVLEMVGGRKNIEVGVDRSSKIYFPSLIHRRLELQEELGLRGITNEEDKGIAKKMIIISLWCIQIDPRARPSMTQVMEMLRGSVEALQIPPKPTLSSPSSRSPIATTDESLLLQFDIATASV